MSTIFTFVSNKNKEHNLSPKHHYHQFITDSRLKKIKPAPIQALKKKPPAHTTSRR